jgi:hypothetical protein
MLQRESTTKFVNCHSSISQGIQELILDLRKSGPFKTIKRRTDDLFLPISELRRLGELMGMSDTPNDIVLGAPPGYFIVRAQRHKTFYGTEFGYACYYIKGCFGFALDGLERGLSSNTIADRLELMMADFNINGFKLFPRMLAYESAESPAISSSASSSPSSPESSPYSEYTGPQNTPVSSAFPSPYSLVLSDSPELLNTPFSSNVFGKRMNTAADAAIYAELTGKANALTISLGSDALRQPSPLFPRYPKWPASLGGRVAVSSTTNKAKRKGRSPRVRLVSPNGTSGNPKPAKTRRRATPYPECGDLFKILSKRRSSSKMPQSPIPPPSPYNGPEGQDLKPPLTFTDFQAHEQPFEPLSDGKAQLEQQSR